MVFITHNLALVRSIAQSAVVLRDGVVVETGPVGQVLEHPADPYTVRLIRDVPKLDTDPARYASRAGHLAAPGSALRSTRPSTPDRRSPGGRHDAHELSSLREPGEA
jgi:ABC-type dipeptide/oligopeptide/nickel transport system ATPase component